MGKKLLSVLLTLALLLSLLPAAYADGEVVASGECGDNLTWTLDEAGTLTISGTGDMWNYSTGSSSFSPAPWFEQREEIKSIVIESGATSIGNSAFSDCIGVTSVSIPEGVTRIGDYSFDYCVALPSIDLPDSTTKIGFCAFENCYSFEKVDIPEKVKELDDYSFCRCRGMIEVTIGGSVTSIGTGTFAECEMLACIRFLGVAPEMANDCFMNVTATAYYPANDPTWTEDVMQDYGGKITWVAGYTISVTGYTKGKAQTSLDLSALYSGEVDFAVTSTDDRAVLVAVKNADGSYTPLKCTTHENGTHHFAVTVNEDTELVLALKGDANLDGELEGKDATMVKRAALHTFDFPNIVARLGCDIDGSGDVEGKDGTMIARAALNTFTIAW